MAMTAPVHARERLKGLRSSAHSTGVFTSDFSVNEFLLVRKAGFEPIGLCVGTCVYHVGIQYGSWSKNQELEVLSKAMYHARELAMSRMRAEATAMQADGIVGVKLTIKRLEWDAQLLEFIAIGTGVVHGDGHKGFRAHDGGPFTSDLSGQDFWSLLHAGIGPSRWSWGPAFIMWRIVACWQDWGRSAAMSNSRTSHPPCTRLGRLRSSGCSTRRGQPKPRASWGSIFMKAAMVGKPT
jgi:uncharacterized protein YbjQ (UPF0145 family)